MRGSIREKGKHSWQIQVYTGTGPDGKPRRYFETVKGRKSDAQHRLNELLVSLEKGVPVPVGRMTVARHLEQWLEGYAKGRCCQRTLESYEGIVRKHLIPALGHLQLKELQPPIIRRYYAKEGEKVTARSVHHYHRALSQSLKWAAREGYLGRNPCSLVDAPSWKGRKMRCLKVELDKRGNIVTDEATPLLKAAEGSPFHPVIFTALNTGLRQAELLALRWRDINLDPPELSISVNQVLYKRRGVCTFKEPKTDGSRRCVNMTPKLALYLASYRAQQEAFYRQHEKELTLDCLVFQTPDGKPIDPSGLSHGFRKLADQAGFGGLRFHDLRHSFASLALLRGVSPKVISEMLGHSSVAFTMDTYSHIMNGMARDAMALLDGVLPEGVLRQSNANLTPTFHNLTLGGR